MAKKFLLGLAVCLWILGAANAQAQCPYYADGQSGDFCYTVSGDTATIVGYVGTSPDIVIPSAIDSMPVTNIGEEAFYDYSWLTGVTIPDSVTTIEWAAFRNCSGLVSVTIPDSVTSIGNNVFDGCNALAEIYVDEGNNFYSSANGVLYNEDKTVLVRYPGGKPGGFTFPDGITIIGPGAFSECPGLTSVVVPDSVTSIGNYAFSDCTRLASVTLGERLAVIGRYVFNNCNSLTTVSIPDSVATIGGGAFCDCSSLSVSYFLGNAPAMGGAVFENTSPEFKICYTAEATGFTTPTWNGYPAADCACLSASECEEGEICIEGECVPEPHPGQWIWMNGSDTGEQAGTYGTIGTPDAANVPGARGSSIVWSDSTGKLWLFGGGGKDTTGSAGYLNDLWRYDPVTNMWTWMSGSDTRNQFGTYGTKGISDINNMPGGRMGSVSWLDSESNLWLFGGYGYDSDGSRGALNDLWRYDPATNMWTWMSGSSARYQVGVYGVKGTADAANVPGARFKSISWTDNSGNFWLFSGGYLNDLWRYDPATNMWTWMSGSSVRYQAGVYGIKGTPDADNVPGGRVGSLAWTDSAGNLWLFGGDGTDNTGGVEFGAPDGYLNDLWRYDVTTGMWTWMSGSGTNDQWGTYGIKGTPDVDNMPGARLDSISWSDSAGNLCLFGGHGKDISGSGGDLNDLWRYDPFTDIWTWMSGSDIADQTGIYGTQGVPDAANVPGARSFSIAWTDNPGNLWLFGGSGYDSAGDRRSLNDLWRYEVPSVCKIDNDCPAGYECMYERCALIPDAYPAFGDGPFVAAGWWPLLSASQTSPTYLKSNTGILWTFSDDFASCSEDCTNSAEYSVAGTSEWTPVTVSSDAAQGYAWAELPVTGLQNATTYAFRYTVTDCVSQTAESGEYYFRVATSDAPPAITGGPWLAAGSWPALPTSASKAFMLNQDYAVLWTFSDDYAYCAGLCTQRARFRKLGDTAWTSIAVSTDPAAAAYAYTTLPVSGLESGTYQFRVEVIDCAGQTGTTGRLYYFTVE